jgi:hypothetical protein
VSVDKASQQALMPDAFFTVAVTVNAIDQLPIFFGYFIRPCNISDK